MFEQASSRGHKQKTQFGEITFPHTIRNQYISGITTVKAAVENKESIKEYQQNFFKSALSESSDSRIKGYSFKINQDKNKTKAFLDKLMMHRIKVLKNGENLFVPTEQKNYRLVRSFFETQEKYRDSVFYDASAWTIANFYDIDYSSSNRKFSGENLVSLDDLFETNSIEKSDYAYIIDSKDYNIPAIIYELLDNKIFTSTSLKPFKIKTLSGDVNFGYGSLVIPVSLQKTSSDKLYEKLKKVQDKYNVDIHSVSSGLSSSGVDLGSRYVSPLTMPKAMMIIGTGVRSYEAGEVWHLLDQRVGMPITKIPIRNFDNISMDSYNTLVMVSGNYKFNDNQLNKIKSWVEKGNTIIGIAGASKYLIDKKLVSETLVKDEKEKDIVHKSYVNAQENRGKEQIGGVILNSIVDLTHPLGFGYEDSSVPVYKNNSVWLSPSKNEYSSVVRYSKDALIDGFMTEKNKEKLEKSVSLVVSKVGRGIAILFADNPNFRGSWYGTNRLFLNAIFLRNKIYVP